jgi:uncharacterized protein (TIGR04255 family)
MPITFDAAPLNEVVVGRTFVPRADFLIPYFGAFWETIKADFPKTTHAQPIISPGDFTGEPSAVFLPRVWFMSDDTTRLIQVQQNRFHFNWRQVDGISAPYMRFANFKPAALVMWERFSTYVSSVTNIELQATGSELTYTNIIEDGSADIWALAERTLRDVAMAETSSSMGRPKNFNLTWVYESPSNIGDLQITAVNGIRPDGSTLLKLDLTMRGKPENSEFGPWMQSAHDYIVKAFKDITTPEMHAAWKLRQE